MNRKISEFLADRQPETPCLVVDLDIVAENYNRLRSALPLADIHYAVKANPAVQILSLLNRLGSNFDAASIYEIERCLATGISADRLSFGSTIKKAGHISQAFRHGVRLFAFDSEAELRKLAASAPGARVFCRILMDGAGADWPLSDKFGCDMEMAVDLMVLARELGLDPYGLSFHVGSQQRDIDQWDVALGRSALIFTALNARGIELKMVNIGGGFPARYRDEIRPVRDYGDAIMRAVTRHFGNRLPVIIAEPGRGIAGDAGLIQSEVVLISQKSYGDRRRWVYLDIGRFGGLPEVMGEAIKYKIRTPRDGGAKGPVTIAGPTCDEVDMLYEDSKYELPLELAVGDKVEIHSAGAYTATYASVGFNGFPPLKEYYI